MTAPTVTHILRRSRVAIQVERDDDVEDQFPERRIS
jgi:hypothetical protein